MRTVRAILRRAATVRSAADLKRRVSSLPVLLFKIAASRHGRKAWSRNTARLVEAARKAGELKPEPGKKKIPPYRIFWSWDLNSSCNYGCPYCFYSSKDDSATLFLSPRDWGIIWRNIYKKYGRCRISVAGGEPSVYPEFPGVISAIAGAHSVEVSTNLSFDPEKLAGKVDPGMLTLNAGFHPLYAGFGDFLEKAGKFSAAGFRLTVSHVAYPAHNLEKIKEYMKEFNRAGIPFIVQPFRGVFRGRRYPDSYSEDEREILREAAETEQPLDERVKVSRPPGAASSEDVNRALRRHNLLKRKNLHKKCRMGQMYAKVYPDGSIYRCCAPDARKMGHIADPGFRLYGTPQSCESLECCCYKRMRAGEESEWMRFWK